MRPLPHVLAVVLALVAASPAAAQTQKYRPAKWYFHDPLMNPASPPYSIGHSSCEAVLAKALEAYRQSGLPRVMVINQPQPQCAPRQPAVRITYRFEDDFPTTPNKEFTVRAYCETQSPLLDPPSSEERGLYCDPQSPAPWKIAGPCDKPGVCGVANPVLPQQGIKYQVETDYAGQGPFALRFERVHLSRSWLSNRAAIGANWWHSYARRLSFGGPGGGVVTSVGAERENGAMVSFNLDGGVYVTDGDEIERLERLPGGGWKLVNGRDETELYHDDGRLLSITDRAGLAQTLAYFGPAGPASDQLQSVTDPFGRTISFEYTASRISAMVNPEGGRTTYAYAANQNGQLLSVTHPDGRTRAYHYENPEAGGLALMLTGITDELGVRVATYAYDTDLSGSPSALRVLSSEGAGGAGKVTFTYAGGSANVTTHVAPGVSSTRAYTFQTVYGVPRNDAVTGPACPGCGPASQAFDANGNLASRTDWNGNRSNYTHDTARNLETSRTEGLTAAGAATPQTRTVTTEWHPTFRLVKRMAEPLRITTNLYNGESGAACGMKADGLTLVPGVLCSKTIQPTSDANGSQGFSAASAGTPRVWSYTWNANGQVLTIDGPRTDVADITTYTYYANDHADATKRGRIATVTDAANNATSITAYNAHGQPLAMTDANGLVTTMVYDARQRLTSRTVGGETTGYQYDAAGQLTRVTLPDASFLAYSYDPAHRLTGIQDNLGNRIAYTLDLAGNRTREEVFDPANALVQTRSRVFSSLNRLFQELGAAGQVTEYAYDSQGNVISVKDPLNRITSNQYDALNRLKQVTDPASGVTQYAYDGIDQLTQVTDPRNLATGYTVNGLGNQTQQLSPDTGTTASTYDAAGNLATQTDAKGQLTTYAYDALNRVTQFLFHDGSKQVYAYDQGTNGKGRLTSITERNPADAVVAQVAYAYTVHGRLASETRLLAGQNYVTAYRYDAAGRLDRITYPSGRSVDYAFDAAGRIERVTTAKDGQVLVAVQSVVYHPFGSPKAWTFGNGQAYNRTVDLDGRVASFTLGGASQSVGFDAASRITSIGANAYGYDALDRLTSAVLPAASFGYSYDAAGNRLTKTTGAGTETYTYSTTSNRIATAGARSFVFDANGSTTADGVNNYVYDTRGRMTQAVSASGTTTYQVNALGQRVRKTNASGDVVFHYDSQGRLIAETDAADAVKREYLYLGEIPVAEIRAP